MTTAEEARAKRAEMAKARFLAEAEKLRKLKIAKKKQKAEEGEQS
jgi:hypothetical protein